MYVLVEKYENYILIMHSYLLDLYPARYCGSLLDACLCVQIKIK